MDYNILFWTVYFIDDYLIYLNDKKGLGWFLKRKKIRSLYAIRRIKSELSSIDSEDVNKVI